MNKIEDYFPVVECGFKPAGYRVVCQLRKPKTKTKGGIILTDDSRDVENDNTQIAKIIALGPAAFRTRDTGASWPEGDWVKVGEYVRIPKYISERWKVRSGDSFDDQVVFCVVKDLDIQGAITVDPLEVLAYV